MASINLLVSGATGWAGPALARGIGRQPDMTLAGAVGPHHAGQRLGDVIGDDTLGCQVAPSAAAALAQADCDVYVEYSKPKDIAIVKANILAALDKGAHVVVASSGLGDADYAEIDAAAQARRRGVLACGNFALTAVLLQRRAVRRRRLARHPQGSHAGRRGARAGQGDGVVSRRSEAPMKLCSAVGSLRGHPTAQRLLPSRPLSLQPENVRRRPKTSIASGMVVRAPMATSVQPTVLRRSSLSLSDSNKPRPAPSRPRVPATSPSSGK